MVKITGCKEVIITRAGENMKTDKRKLIYLVYM